MTTSATSATSVATTEQVYGIFIKASAEEIWEAITKPEFTARYFHGGRIRVRTSTARSARPATCGATA